VPTGPAEPSFTDVPTDFWAFRHIEYCANPAQDVVRGFEDGSYRPLLPVNRDAMAVYVARAIAGGDDGVPTGPLTATFSDVPTDHWAFRYIEYCADESQGVVTGYPDGTYRPDLAVTRDQMAVYVTRAFDLATPPARYSLSDYYPLAEGDTWTINTNWGVTTETISGTEEIWGSLYARQVNDEGYASYWQASSDGLRNSGWYEPGTGTVTLNPPLLLRNCLELGYSESQSLPTYLNGSPIGVTQVTYTLVGLETITVPAGTFEDCVKLDVTFQPAGEPAERFYTWVAKGVGQVRRDERPFGGTGWEELLAASVSGVDYPQSYALINYFPLNQGDTWTYGPVGSGYTVTVSGTAQLRGRPYTTMVIFAENHVSYYQPTADGILFGGEYDGGDGVTIAFEPPLLLPNGMALGETRTMPTSLYVNDVYQGGGTASLGLVAVETVAVPAGTFPLCLKLDLQADIPPALSGREYQWWAPGIGMVRKDDRPFGGSDYHELLSASVLGVTYP